MIELLGNLIGFVFDMVGFVLDLAFGAVEFVFGLLGGVLGLLLSLGWVALGAVAILFIVKRRREYRAHREGPVCDADAEEDFVSFYDQEDAAAFSRRE